MLKAIKHLKVPGWVSLYCERWLKAPMVTESGNITQRDKGTPQGGVIIPVLAKLFLHYGLDEWFKQKRPGIKFARYADDLVAHYKSYAKTILWPKESFKTFCRCDKSA